MIPVVRYHRVPHLIDELFQNDFFGGTVENRPYKPAVNISETESDYSVNLAVPGYEKNDLKISIEDKMLTISHDIEVKENEETKILKKEFSSGNFKRTFKLPENAETDKIEASHLNGVLSIRIPKRAKIEIPVKEILVK